MIILLAAYTLYLLLFAVVSFAIIFHLRRYSLPGDNSGKVLLFYIVLSILIIVGTLIMIVPVPS